MNATHLTFALVVSSLLACQQRPAETPTTLTHGESSAAPAPAANGGERNMSTTLGDGTSGMYTGGVGTYGGKASWGTGRGAPVAAAEPVVPPPAAAPPPAPPAPAHAAIKAAGKAQVDGDEIKIPGKIHFATNKSAIKEDKETTEILSTLVEVMKANPGITKLRIEGHTDDRGESSYNHKLSQARADAVADWLAKHGVDRGRIATIGLGEEKPIGANDTEDHREANRRTEFKVWEYDGQPTDTAKAAK